jgi:hypothetical protein
MKRVTWFVGGVVAGVAGAGYAKKKVKSTAAHLAPTNVVKVASVKVRRKGVLPCTPARTSSRPAGTPASRHSTIGSIRATSCTSTVDPSTRLG